MNARNYEIIQAFNKFGLSEYEGRAYFTLLVCGRLSASNLWKKSGLPQSKVYQVIHTLTAKGLVDLVGIKPVQVQSKPLYEFVLNIIREKKRLVSLIDRTVSEYREVFANNQMFLRVI